MRKKDADPECQPERRVNGAKRLINSPSTKEIVKCEVGTSAQIMTHNQPAVKSINDSNGSSKTAVVGYDRRKPKASKAKIGQKRAERKEG